MRSNQMEFSFVIPTYNKGESLRKTLETLNHQEGYGIDGYEVVVVDDGSVESVFPSIKGVNRNYRLNYLYLERSSRSCRSRARNYGIRAARGKYIVFIDDDILVTRGHLREIHRYYRQSENLVLLGLRINCSPGLLAAHGVGEIKKRAFGADAARMAEERHLAFNSLSYNLSAHRYPWVMTVSCNVVAPRAYLERTGGFDENFRGWGYEDLELGYRLHRAGCRFMINPSLTVFHQPHPTAPPGKDNFSSFVEKCGEIFKEIDPMRLMTLFGLNTRASSKLSLYRRYQGPITRRETIDFTDAAELEEVKEKITRYAGIGGCEVTINDHVETAGLDYWVQALDVDGAVVNYYPESGRLSKEAAFGLLKRLMAGQKQTNRTQKKEV